jgi:hypothetical protein
MKLKERHEYRTANKNGIEEAKKYLSFVNNILLHSDCSLRERQQKFIFISKKQKKIFVLVNVMRIPLWLGGVTKKLRG